MWQSPSRPSVLINFSETIMSCPVIHRVVRWGISHFFKATRNTTEGVGEKEQRTNEQYGLGSTQSARRVVLWHCIPCVFVDYRGRVFARNFDKLLGMPTHLWPSSSLPLDSTSRRLRSSAVHCRLPHRVSLRQLLSGFLYQLTLWLLSDLPFLSHFRSRRKSRVQALCLVSRQNRQRDRLLSGPPTLCHKVGDLKAPFSLATTSRCKGGRYSFQLDCSTLLLTRIL